MRSALLSGHGGGIGELGVGRGQIELLAAIFHSSVRNTISPRCTTC
jgi:hypothetical protein